MLSAGRSSALSFLASTETTYFYQKPLAHEL